MSPAPTVGETMMTAEHRRPFAAFVLVFAFACFVMANGLREQVVRVFVDSGAPRPLISAVVPDIVLGRSLHHAPPAPKPAADLATPPVESQPLASTPVTTVVTSTQAAPSRPHRGATHHAHKSHATPAKPKHTTAVAPVHVKNPTPPVTPTPPTTPTPGGGINTGGGTVRPPSAGPKGVNSVDDNGSHHNWGGHHHSNHNPGHHSEHNFGGPTKNSDSGDHGHHSDHGFRVRRVTVVITLTTRDATTITVARHTATVPIGETTATTATGVVMTGATTATVGATAATAATVVGAAATGAGTTEFTASAVAPRVRRPRRCRCPRRRPAAARR